MDRQGLFQGMLGEVEMNPKLLKPRGLYVGDGATDNRKVNVGYVGYKKAPPMFSQVIDYSTRRGVLPCYNINRFVIRNPPKYGPTHGLVPVGGMSRTQNNNLANARRPINLPIQQKRSNINAAQVINLPIPSK